MVAESSVVLVGTSATEVVTSIVDVSKLKVDTVTEDSTALSDSVTVVVSSEVTPEVVCTVSVVADPADVAVSVSLVHDDVAVVD